MKIHHGVETLDLIQGDIAVYEGTVYVVDSVQQSAISNSYAEITWRDGGFTWITTAPITHEWTVVRPN